MCYFPCLSFLAFTYAKVMNTIWSLRIRWTLLHMPGPAPTSTTFHRARLMHRSHTRDRRPTKRGPALPTHDQEPFDLESVWRRFGDVTEVWAMHTDEVHCTICANDRLGVLRHQVTVYDVRWLTPTTFKMAISINWHFIEEPGSCFSYKLKVAYTGLSVHVHNRVQFQTLISMACYFENNNKGKKISPWSRSGVVSLTLCYFKWLGCKYPGIKIAVIS